MSMVSSLGGAPKMLIFVECEDAWVSAPWENWGPWNGMCWGWGEGRPPPSDNLERGCWGTIWAGSAWLSFSASFIRIHVALQELPKAPEAFQKYWLCPENFFMFHLWTRFQSQSSTHTDAYTHTYMHTNQKSKIICHFLRNSPSRIVFFLSENSTIWVDCWWFWSSGVLNSRFCGPAGLGSQSSRD